MFGPRIEGKSGVSLIPPTLEHFKLQISWVVQPEIDRFWGPRFGELTEERQQDRFEKTGQDQTQIMWTIEYQGEPVGWTGIFEIDWVRRDGESGIVIGRADLFGRGIASEAVRLRTGFAWREMRLHRVHNWIALANRGSRRANEKSGYKQMGVYQKSFFRSGEWYDEWLGEAYPHTFPEQG